MKEKYTIPKEFHDEKIAEGFCKGDPSSIRKGGGSMEDLSKAIYLLDNITENMEWIKLLLEKDRFIAPLTTHDLIMKRLEQVKEIVKSNYIDNKPRKTDFTTIETPTSIGTPTEYNTFTGDKPFDRDSVGGEELHETS